MKKIPQYPRVVETYTVGNEESYLVKFNKNMQLWVDSWKDNENNTCYDWNQYIFFLNNARDVEIKSFQENSDNYEDALTAIDKHILNL